MAACADVDLGTGIVCATLGQCLAGISTDYAMLAGFQGAVFGLGLGLVRSHFWSHLRNRTHQADLSL